MRRAALALLFSVACHSPLPPPPPPASARAVVVDQPSPFDALDAEASRHDLALRVTREGRVIFERKAESIGSVGVFMPLLTQLPRAIRDSIGVADAGLRLTPANAERVALMLADGALGRVPQWQRWETLGEGELAVVTRPLFDSWRGVRSLQRATLDAVEPLVDTEIPVEDFERALGERIGRDVDLFLNELAKAQRKPYERRWRTTIGFGAIDTTEAVVVLTRTKLVAVYASASASHDMRNLIRFIRALE